MSYTIKMELVDNATGKILKSAKAQAKAMGEVGTAGKRATDKVAEGYRRQASATKSAASATSILTTAIKSYASVRGVQLAARWTLDFAKTADQARISMLGLQLVAKNQGQSFSAVERATKSLMSDGLLPMHATTTAIRNLMVTGLSVDQAVETLNRFKDIAAIGRNSSVSFEQAVVNLSQAFKTGQSELGDASGLTENWSLIAEEGARKAEELGISFAGMSEQAKMMQLRFLGLIDIHQNYEGGVAAMTSGVTGSIAQMEQAWFQLKIAIGSAIGPAIQDEISAFAGQVNALANAIEQSGLVQTVVPLLASILALSRGQIDLTGLSAASAAFAGARGPRGFSPADIESAFGALGLPAPTTPAPPDLGLLGLATSAFQLEGSARTTDVTRQRLAEALERARNRERLIADLGSAGPRGGGFGGIEIPEIARRTDDIATSLTDAQANALELSLAMNGVGEALVGDIAAGMGSLVRNLDRVENIGAAIANVFQQVALNLAAAVAQAAILSLLPGVSFMGAFKGIFGFSRGGPVPGYAAGGEVHPVYLAGGGGFVPRGTDRVPAMLTPGEHVVTRQDVQRAGGHRALDRLVKGGGPSISIAIQGGTYVGSGGMREFAAHLHGELLSLVRENSYERLAN